MTDLGIPGLRTGVDLVPAYEGEDPQNAKQYTSDQEVRWCPGCGDYAILAAVQSFLPELGLKRENITFVSGIGCSSRFPYYLDTYGMHSIHGRAPAIATGLATSRPDQSSTLARPASHSRRVLPAPSRAWPSAVSAWRKAMAFRLRPSAPATMARTWWVPTRSARMTRKGPG